MLLRQIKSESYGVLRYKLFRPSLSAKQKRNRLENKWLRFLYVSLHPDLHPLLGAYLKIPKQVDSALGFIDYWHFCRPMPD